MPLGLNISLFKFTELKPSFSLPNSLAIELSTFSRGFSSPFPPGGGLTDSDVPPCGNSSKGLSIGLGSSHSTVPASTGSIHLNGNVSLSES